MEPFKIEGNQSKSLEQDEKIKNDKLRKLIYKCTVTLSISSPLSCKLRERLASILPKVSSNPFPWHEKYCKTNIRLHYGDYTPYSSHLHPQYKPPRPLRSNTSIVEEKTSVPSSWSSSSKASDVHHYSFNRKQRYRRWTQIEDKYSSVFDETDSYNNIITLESDNSNDSEVKSNPRLSSWSTTPVIFPIIDFDEIVEAQLEKEARSRLQYQAEYSDHNSHVNPPYIIFFVPDDSNKSVPNETVANLPPSLGYEIILEPMNISSTSLPPHTSSPSSSSSSPPISTSPSPDRTTISCDQEKPELVKNDNNLIQTDVKLIHKSISEIPKKDFAPLRRSMRREKISSKSNCVINETNQSSIRVEPKRTQATNKNSSSVCDIDFTATHSTDQEECHEMESNVSVGISPVKNHQNEIISDENVPKVSNPLPEPPEQNMTASKKQSKPETTNALAAVPEDETPENIEFKEQLSTHSDLNLEKEPSSLGPKPDKKGSKEQSKPKIHRESRAVTRTRKRVIPSPLALPSTSSSKGQPQKKSPNPKRVKHSSEDDDDEWEQLFWEHLHPFNDFVTTMRGKMLIIEDDPNLFALNLVHILGTRIIDLEKKLNERPTPSDQDQFNERIWITKDGQRKLFTYRIKKMNGEFVEKYDMESEFKKKYMEPRPKNYFACKGTPNCVHPPLEKTGRSNKIYDHIRKNLRYAFVCIYCPLGNGSNFEQFSKHLKEHFDEHGVQPVDSDDKSAR